ncbi:MAG: hypothetical protein H0U23_13800 [Blastocatellia bacterium]|nr:hypothetical protein [Blastocatellia bacterium]
MQRVTRMRARVQPHLVLERRATERLVNRLSVVAAISPQVKLTQGERFVVGSEIKYLINGMIAGAAIP